MFQNTKIKKKHLNKGFTLVELLVTISMFVIITGVVLVNSNKFDSTILLHNFAYDVALTIKQAQSYGVNTSESSQGDFNSYYGVYFDTTETGGSPTNFLLFDYNPISKKDLSGLSSVIQNSLSINGSCSLPYCMQKYTMKKGTSINEICVGDKANTCTPFVGKFVIIFQRPKLDAMIYTISSGSTFTENKYANITLSAGNATSTVVVTSVGQIYVKK